MITAEFTKVNKCLCAFGIKGHAGFADYGKDIVCASVTSAVQLTANAVTEVLQINAEVYVGENIIRLTLPKNSPKEGYDFVEALYLHLKVLSEDYEGSIKIKVLEVQQ